jgi:hypothetical protein
MTPREACIRGHSLMLGHPNTYVDPKTGARHCRACKAVTDRAAYLRRRAPHLSRTPVRSWTRRVA